MVGFAFEDVVGADGHGNGYRGWRPGLLDDVGQLVSEEVPAGGGVRRKLAGGEDDVAADGIRESTDGVSGLRSTRAGVDANATEVVTKTRFEEFAAGRVEGRAGGAEDFMNDRRNGGRLRGTRYARAL
jgi:hypothetical protein